MLNALASRVCHFHGVPAVYYAPNSFIKLVAAYNPSGWPKLSTKWADKPKRPLAMRVTTPAQYMLCAYPCMRVCVCVRMWC